MCFFNCSNVTYDWLKIRAASFRCVFRTRNSSFSPIRFWLTLPSMSWCFSLAIWKKQIDCHIYYLYGIIRNHDERMVIKHVLEASEEHVLVALEKHVLEIFRSRAQKTDRDSSKSEKSRSLKWSIFEKAQIEKEVNDRFAKTQPSKNGQNFRAPKKSGKQEKK